MKFLKNNSGITLIALIVTIIVLLILAGISLKLVAGSAGILNRAEKASDITNESYAREKLDLFCMGMQAEKYSNEKYNQNEYLTSKIEESGWDLAEEDEDVVIVDGWKFLIDRSVPKVIENLGKGIQSIKITGEVENAEDYTKAYLKIDIVSENDITSIKIDDEAIDIPTKEDGKYTITKTVTKNKDYLITVKDIERKEKTKKLKVSEIATDMDIYNLEDLKTFRNKVNSGATFEGCTIRLMNDIDLSSACGESIGNWEPIGNFDKNSKLCFVGKFKGNNHTISNLYINDPNLSYQGFFGTVKNGSISDLNVTGTVNAKQISGGIVGRIAESITSVTIQNCTNKSTVTAERTAGGIVGIVEANTNASANIVILNCNNTGEIITTNAEEGWHDGGICGYCYKNNYLKISNCKNSGVIVAKKSLAGGILGGVGELGECLIEKSVNTGNVTVQTTTSSGGILGGVEDGGKAEIQKSYNTGAINSKQYSSGGIAGLVWDSGSNLKISNVYNEGKISVGISHYGGIIGAVDHGGTATISYSHNVGKLEGSNDNKGTMLGYRDADNTNAYKGNSNYWLTPASNADYSIGSAKYSMEENILTVDKMKEQTNFTNWDFENIWEMDTTKGYPILKNMPQ